MRRLALLLLLLLLPAGVVLLDRALPPDLTRLHAVSTEVLDRGGRTLTVLPAGDTRWRLPATVADVPPHLIDLLIAAEDRRFRQHPGVDPLALARAAGQWLRAGRVVSGGSTLSMQAARLLEPRPRTLRSKAIEIVRALQLEARYGKDEILGIWLTLAPMGGTLEGVRAGALAWFGRPAARLDVAEAALLLALARRPEATRPDRHPGQAWAAREAVLRQRAAGAPGLSEADLALASAAPLPRRRLPLPHAAPHLARRLAAAAPGARVPTTLDARLQAGLEGLAAATLPELPPRASLAVLVAELGTRELRGVVGGFWQDPARAGALDLSRAIRSPGSAAKPALYALAFEAGLAQPETLLADLPRRFGAYAPENFDGGFDGRVTVAEALRRSLNMPAVGLLAELGPLRLAAALKAAGAPIRLAPGLPPGLPLALGGFGTSLTDLASVYAALGDGGRAGPLTARPGGAAPAGQVFTPAAAALTTAILVQPFPQGGPAGIAWKTGTSWGGRDAWAFGVDGRHVVAVWVGRPDGSAMPGATGARLALPLLARAFALLPAAPLAPLPPRAPVLAAGAAPTDRLRLTFPPPGALLAPEGPAVTLRASGGRRPLTFLVDGAPVPAMPAKREAAWAPPGPGFYRVTVIDAAGEAAAAEVRVK